MSAAGWSIGWLVGNLFYIFFSVSRYYDLRMDDKWDWTTETAYNHGVWDIDDCAGAQICQKK